jgi:hypothetical protein
MVEIKIMRHIYSFALFIVVWLGGFEPDNAVAQALESGIYENLMLAVDTQGKLTGYYREDQGQGVTKHCAFFLAGNVLSNKADVLTWSDPVFPGTVTATPDGATLKVPKGRDHSGCGLVLLPQIDQGISLDRIERTSWTELRSISVDRAFLHRDSAESSRLRSYLIKGDAVGVLTAKGDWIQAEYLGKNGKIRGWIRTVDTKKIEPPTHQPQ